MALNVKDEETDRLVRELAALTGESITVTIRTAVGARLDQVRRQKQRADGPSLEGIIIRGRARATIDTRPEADILGYGHDGLPT